MRRLELGFDTKVTNRESLRAVVEDVRQIRKEAEAAEAKLKTAFSNKGTQAAGLKAFDQSFNRQLSDIDRQLSDIEQSFSRSSAAASSFNTVLQGIAVASVVTASEELARYAARTETLSVVTDQLSKVNGINVQATRQQVDAVKALGITTQESLSTINRMIAANLDLRRATDLARVAQDAAIISNKNSSEALDGLILGITTRNSRVLRTYGIVVDFEREYRKVAQEYGRELTNTEKVQVAFNTVLEKGAQIQGSYEAAMLTTGKQLTSLSRKFDEAKNSIGTGFIPILGAAVRELGTLATYLEKNGDVVSKFIVATSAGWAGSRIGGAIGGAISGARGGLAGAAIGTAVGIIGGSYFAPSEEGNILPAAKEGMESLRARRVSDLERIAQTADPKERDRLKSEVEANYLRSIDDLKDAVSKAYANVFIKAVRENKGTIAQLTGQGISKDADEKTMAGLYAQRKLGSNGIQIGPEMSISLSDVSRAITNRLTPAKISGPLLNTNLRKQEQDEQLQAEFRERVKKAMESLEKFYVQLDDVGLDGFGKLLMDLSQKQKEAVLTGTLKEFNARADAAVFSYLAAQSGKKFEAREKNFITPTVRESQEAAARLSAGTPGTQQIIDPGTNRVVTALRVAPQGMDAGIGEQYSARAAGYQASITRQRERDYQLLQQMGDLEARRAELQGDQVAGLVKGFEVRMRILDIEKELGGLGKTQFDLDMERLRAREELEIRVLEIRKQQKEATKEEAGKLFDALTANGASGITDYFSNLWKLNFRKIFQNTAGELFGGMSGKFQLPGQTNKDGSLNFFGKILQGTIGGVDPAKQLESATSQNTRETAQNNDLLRRMNDLLRRAQGLPAEAGGTSVGSIAGSVGALIPSGVLQGSIGAASPIFSLIDSSMRKSSVLPGWSGTSADSAVAREMAASMPAGTPVNINDNARGAAFAKGVGYATTIASGGMAVYAGIKQGGTQGYLNAASAGLATAAAVDHELISKGVLMAAAALSSIASNVFGISEADRRKRSAEIDRTIAGARYKAPDQIEKEIDAATGGSVDTNSRGEIRVYMNVSAVDTKSFLDYKDEISQAVREGIAEGGALREEIRSIAAVA